MRQACLEAKVFGDKRAPVGVTLPKVLVVLNPSANKRKAEENFESYCAPILNLAGFNVEVVKTLSEQHAIRYIEEEMTEYPDSLVVAGGDGTLSEAITGLLRKAENDPKIPAVGVLPCGKINQFSLMLFNSEAMPKNKVEEVKAMADAALAVVKGKTEEKDVMKIQLIPGENAEMVAKPFYAVGSLFWGSFNDIFRKKDRYWITGPWREFTAFLFKGFGSSDITWNCKADLIYSDPCSGCSNCYEKLESRTQKLQSGRWWSKFNAVEKPPEYSKTLNPNCLTIHEQQINTSELVISTNTAEGLPDTKSKMNIKVNTKPDDTGIDYILSSWRRLREKKYLEIPESSVTEARTVVLRPEDNGEDDSELYYSIDNEAYEVMPIKITLLPRRVRFFTQ
jgi:acylglycerol kinase